MSSVQVGDDWIVVKGRKFRRRQAGGGGGGENGGGKVSWRRQRSQRKAVAGDLVGQGGDQTKGGKSSDKGQPGNKGGKSSGKGQPDNKGAGHQGRYKESARAKAGTYHSASSGPWVCCTNLQCKGHNGGTSFKYVASIGVGTNGMACMGCGQPWEDSLVEALAAGAIPDFAAEQDAVGSPFAAASLAPGGNEWTCQMPSPFTTPTLAALPNEIQVLVDERLRADFLLVLDPAKSDADKKKVLDFVEDYAARGNGPAANFLEALVKAKPLVAPPRPVLAVGGSEADPKTETIQQKVAAAKRRRNELDTDRIKKQRALDQLVAKKVALLPQRDKVQLELNAADELHIAQSQELVEAERLLGEQTAKVQALELELPEACRPTGAASSFAAPRAVEVLDPIQKAAAIKEIIGSDINEVLHLLLETFRQGGLHFTGSGAGQPQQPIVPTGPAPMEIVEILDKKRKEPESETSTSEADKDAKDPETVAADSAAAAPAVPEPPADPVEDNPLGLSSSLDEDEEMPPLASKGASSSAAAAGTGRSGPYTGKKARAQADAPDTLQLALDIAAALAKAKNDSSSLPPPATKTNINSTPLGTGADGAGDGAAGDGPPPIQPASG